MRSNARKEERKAEKNELQSRPRRSLVRQRLQRTQRKTFVESQMRKVRMN